MNEKEKINGANPFGTKSTGQNTIKRNEQIFLFFFLLYPVLQFIIFYIGVNFNSILLAFQEYDTLKGTFSYVGFATLKTVLEDIFVNGNLTLAIKNSTIQFALNFFLGIPLHIIVAYGVFKKIPCSGFIKIMLFMPNMINSMVFVVCGEYIIENGLPLLFGDGAMNLLSRYNPNSFYTVLFFGFWMQFAGGLIVYLGAMSGIDKEIMEYGKLEQLSSLRELWSIVIPLIFPTITTYIIVGISGFFTNQGFYFSFYSGSSGPYDTLGYFFFAKVAGKSGGNQYYPYASAGGLLFTLVLTPITLGVRSLLEKYGPGEN